MRTIYFPIGKKNKSYSNISDMACLFYLLLPIPFVSLNTTFSGAISVGVILCALALIQRRYFFDMYMMTTMFFFVVGELLSLIICPDISKTFVYSVQKSLVVLIVYSFMRGTLRTNSAINQAIKMYKVGCIISAVFVLISFTLNVNISFISTKFLTERLTIAGLGPNVIGRMFCIGALYALYEAQVKCGKEKLVAYIECIVITVSLLTTVSSAGIGLFIIGAVWIYLCYNSGVKRIGILNIILVLIFMILACYLIYRYVPMIQVQINKLITREVIRATGDAAEGGFSLHGRMEGLENYGENVRRHFLVGIGYGCSSYLVGRTIHFPLLSSLVENGICGFISCLVLYGYPMKCVIHIFRAKKERIFAILSAIILIGDMIQPNPNYVFTWFAIYLSCCSYRLTRITDIEGRYSIT